MLEKELDLILKSEFRFIFVYDTYESFSFLKERLCESGFRYLRDDELKKIYAERFSEGNYIAYFGERWSIKDALRIVYFFKNRLDRGFDDKVVVFTKDDLFLLKVKNIIPSRLMEVKIKSPLSEDLGILNALVKDLNVHSYEEIIKLKQIEKEINEDASFRDLRSEEKSSIIEHIYLKREMYFPILNIHHFFKSKSLSKADEMKHVLAHLEKASKDQKFALKELSLIDDDDRLAFLGVLFVRASPSDIWFFVPFLRLLLSKEVFPKLKKYYRNKNLLKHFEALMISSFKGVISSEEIDKKREETIADFLRLSEWEREALVVLLASKQFAKEYFTEWNYRDAATEFLQEKYPTHKYDIVDFLSSKENVDDEFTTAMILSFYKFPAVFTEFTNSKLHYFLNIRGIEDIYKGIQEKKIPFDFYFLLRDRDARLARQVEDWLDRAHDDLRGLDERLKERFIPPSVIKNQYLERIRNIEKYLKSEGQWYFAREFAIYRQFAHLLLSALQARVKVSKVTNFANVLEIYDLLNESLCLGEKIQMRSFSLEKWQREIQTKVASFMPRFYLRWIENKEGPLMATDIPTLIQYLLGGSATLNDKLANFVKDKNLANDFHNVIFIILDAFNYNFWKRSEHLMKNIGCSYYIEPIVTLIPTVTSVGHLGMCCGIFPSEHLQFTPKNISKRAVLAASNSNIYSRLYEEFGKSIVLAGVSPHNKTIDLSMLIYPLTTDFKLDFKKILTGGPAGLDSIFTDTSSFFEVFDESRNKFFCLIQHWATDIHDGRWAIDRFEYVREGLFSGIVNFIRLLKMRVRKKTAVIVTSDHGLLINTIGVDLNRRAETLPYITSGVYKCSNCGKMIWKDPLEKCPDCGSETLEKKAEFGLKLNSDEKNWLIDVTERSIRVFRKKSLGKVSTREFENVIEKMLNFLGKDNILEILPTEDINPELNLQRFKCRPRSHYLSEIHFFANRAGFYRTTTCCHGSFYFEEICVPLAIFAID